MGNQILAVMFIQIYMIYLLYSQNLIRSMMSRKISIINLSKTA